MGSFYLLFLLIFILVFLPVNVPGCFFFVVCFLPYILFMNVYRNNLKAKMLFFSRVCIHFCSLFGPLAVCYHFSAISEIQLIQSYKLFFPWEPVCFRSTSTSKICSQEHNSLKCETHLSGSPCYLISCWIIVHFLLVISQTSLSRCLSKHGCLHQEGCVRYLEAEVCFIFTVTLLGIILLERTWLREKLKSFP